MKAKKVYLLKTSKDNGYGNKERHVHGTVEQLTKYFGYTLEVGNSIDRRINRQPKTIASLVSNLRKAYDAKEASCYNRTFIEQVTGIEADEYFSSPEYCERES